MTPEGVFGNGSFALSPDGKLLACFRKGIGELYDVEGGVGRAVPGLQKDWAVIRWCADGRLFVRTLDNPVRVYRLTLSTGRLELWKEFSIPGVDGLAVTILPVPDGKSYVYGYTKSAADLFIAEGLK